jgi:N-acetylmuramoyl-L-alanine amidase
LENNKNNNKKRLAVKIAGIAAASVFLAAVLIMVPVSGRDLFSVFNMEPGAKGRQLTVIVDPGHGGIDGGAVGVDNIVEKDINLSIGLKLRDLLEAHGVDVIMTRETDISIHDDSAKTTKQIKTSDLRNRMKIMEENPDALFISIHQNKFQKSSSSGCQVFYGANNLESEYLAQAIQKTVCEAIQKDNSRQIKAATDELYLLDKTKNIAVMVECGFISNPDEARLLISEDYQKKLAFCIYAGLVRYFVQA